jgi:hypothetical protein
MAYIVNDVNIYWKDEPDTIHPVRIVIGEWGETIDDDIFFYAKDEDEFKELYNPNNLEEFVIEEQEKK